MATLAIESLYIVEYKWGTEVSNPSLSANPALHFQVGTGALKTQGAMNPFISSLGRESNVLNQQIAGDGFLP
jgi:hypothetical protein